MKTRYVELIAAIAEQGGIAAAAAHLGKTQPAISSALRKAETELGAQLFDRRPHGVVPTEIGKIVVERCIKILSDLRSVDEAVQQSKGSYKGRLDIIATPMAAIGLLPDVLRVYTRKLPEISVVSSNGQTPQAFHDLRKGMADFLLGPPPTGDMAAGLETIAITESRVLIVTGKGSKYGQIANLTDARQARWLDHGSPRRRPLFFGLFEGQGIAPPEPIVCADSVSCLLSLVEGSDFLFCVPEKLLNRLQGNWEFDVLALSDQIQPVKINLTFARDRVLTPAALTFADVVQQVSQKDPAMT